MKKYIGILIFIIVCAIGGGSALAFYENSSRNESGNQARPAAREQRIDQVSDAKKEKKQKHEKHTEPESKSEPEVKSGNSDKQNENHENSDFLSWIASEDHGGYTMYHSDLFDTYAIACALYFDFKTCNLIQPQNSLYQEAADYFKPYKEHSFIKNLGEYVDSECQDISGDFAQLFCSYLYSNGIDGEEPLKGKEIKISEDKNLQSFLDGLTQFYEDTDAADFFADHHQYYTLMFEAADQAMQANEVSDLIGLMEDYTGTREKYYPKKTIHYTSLISIYRPQGASFFHAELSKGIYFIAYESAFQEAGNLKSINITGTMESAIHEYLHLYINPEAENEKDNIEKLAANRNKIVFGGMMYQEFPWYRIVDENIVRAVETRIYGQYYNSYQRAYEQVLQKEIEWGGFGHVESAYYALEAYEQNRKKYDDISKYVPELVKAMFNE